MTPVHKMISVIVAIKVAQLSLPILPMMVLVIPLVRLMLLGLQIAACIVTMGVHTKGSFDLIHALTYIRYSTGETCNLLALTQGSTQALADFATSVEEQGLSPLTWLLPFIPHWCIPQFIRTCTAVCFLERDFPIPIHTPLIPREVLACGTCLILSHEVAEKQSYHQKFQHGSNVFLVDPLDIDALTETLQAVIRDPVASQQIGKNGYHDISVKLEDFSAYAQGWIQLFITIQNDIQQM